MKDGQRRVMFEGAKKLIKNRRSSAKDGILSKFSEACITNSSYQSLLEIRRGTVWNSPSDSKVPA